MVRFSNILIGLLNFITLIISIPIVGFLLWYESHISSISDTPLKLMYWPILVLSLFIMVQSLLGLFGACCRISFFLWVYLFVTFVLILAVSGILVFGFIITSKTVGDVFPNKSFMQYRLGNYSGWLHDQVVNADNWKEITMNMKETNLCATSGGLFKTDITPIKSGCCTPPTRCGFTYVNATYWTIPKSGPSSTEKDCKTWTNDESKLCFDCDSCKAGILQYIQHIWKAASIFFGSFLGFLIIVYTIGCCALRNNKDAKYQRYGGYR